MAFLPSSRVIAAQAVQHRFVKLKVRAKATLVTNPYFQIDVAGPHGIEHRPAARPRLDIDAPPALKVERIGNRTALWMKCADIHIEAGTALGGK
jgi:hypothetical protein